MGEITICTQSALQDGEVEAVDKTIFIAKKAPDRTIQIVEMAPINMSVLAASTEAERVIAVLYQVVEGFEDLSSFKRISVNIGG